MMINTDREMTLRDYQIQIDDSWLRLGYHKSDSVKKLAEKLNIPIEKITLFIIQLEETDINPKTGNELTNIVMDALKKKHEYKPINDEEKEALEFINKLFSLIHSLSFKIAADVALLEVKKPRQTLTKKKNIIINKTTDEAIKSLAHILKNTFGYAHRAKVDSDIVFYPAYKYKGMDAFYDCVTITVRKQSKTQSVLMLLLKNTLGENNWRTPILDEAYEKALDMLTKEYVCEQYSANNSTK